jgi:hypothetical protein
MYAEMNQDGGLSNRQELSLSKKFVIVNLMGN